MKKKKKEEGGERKKEEEEEGRKSGKIQKRQDDKGHQWRYSRGSGVGQRWLLRGCWP